MGSAGTSVFALAALPAVLAAGCATAHAEHGASSSALVYSTLPEFHDLRASSELRAPKTDLRGHAPPNVVVAAPATPATPWITGLYGLIGAESAGPRRSLAPWTDDPWMTIEPPVYTRHLTVAYGEQTVTDDDAQILDIDEERVYGLDYDSFEAPSGHGWECGANVASADGSFMGLDGDYQTRELYAGYRRTFLTQVRGVQPYLSIGVMHMHADMQLGSMRADDSAYGAYGRLGINWELSDRIRIGLDYRRVYGTEIDALGLGIDSDHDQLALTVGYGF
jgi:hypothetical protein